MVMVRITVRVKVSSVNVRVRVGAEWTTEVAETPLMSEYISN